MYQFKPLGDICRSSVMSADDALLYCRNRYCSQTKKYAIDYKEDTTVLMRTHIHRLRLDQRPWTNARSFNVQSNRDGPEAESTMICIGQ